MRPVDADALLQRAIPLGWSSPKWVSDIMIDDAPTIDAVPVVRCKDCKWKVVTKLKENYCLRCEDIVKDDYFCADGAKMERSEE